MSREYSLILHVDGGSGAVTFGPNMRVLSGDFPRLGPRGSDAFLTFWCFSFLSLSLLRNDLIIIDNLRIVKNYWIEWLNIHAFTSGNIETSRAYLGVVWNVIWIHRRPRLGHLNFRLWETYTRIGQVFLVLGCPAIKGAIEIYFAISNILIICRYSHWRDILLCGMLLMAVEIFDGSWYQATTTMMTSLICALVLIWVKYWRF